MAVSVLVCSEPVRAEFSPDGSNWLHIVQRGDTLIGLVQTWAKPGTDWRTLAAANRVQNPYRLHPGSTLRIPREVLNEEPTTLEVLHTHGEVQIERAGQAPAALVGGMTVRNGDVLRSGRQSSATLRSPDGSKITLREESVLEVVRHGRLGAAAQQNTELKLDKGAADTQVAPPAAGQSRPRLQIRTPVINLGVRGTEFRARTLGDVAIVEVLTGRVAATTPQAAPELAVQAGFGVRASAAGLGMPVALPSAPDVNGLPQKVERLPLMLAWQAPPATSWRAQVHRMGEPDQVLLDGVFTVPRAQWVDDLPDGRYGLRLRAITAQGIEGNDARFEFELKARPEPPFLNTPPDRSRTADASQTFSWTGQAAAARYRIQVADQPDFARPSVDRSDIAATNVTLELPEGSHHWRVASVRANGDVGPWSDTLSTTRVARPAAPGAEAPVAQTEGLMLRWRGALDMRFQLQVARDPGFTSSVADTTIDQAEWLLVKPEPGTYYMRVRSISRDGFAGPFGATQTLEVPAPPPPPQPIWPWFVPLLIFLL